MRIEAYNQVQQLYKTKPVNKSKQAGGASRTDQLQISSAGKDFQAVKAAVAAAPDVREEMISSIKSQVQSGTYSVETTAFADKLMKKFDEMR